MAAQSSVRSARIAIPICGVNNWRDAAQVIANALKAVAGVYSVYVNPAMEMVYLQYDPEICQADEFAEAIERIGFHAGEASLR